MFSSNTSQVSGDVLYVDDVFSTWLYTGNGATGQTITNGIDLAGKGGLVWIKNRSTSADHLLYDTTRGANRRLATNTTNGTGFESNQLNSFNSNGFTLGGDGALNAPNRNTDNYASWAFREESKFFDVVAYTGNGANRTISHNLGSVPGCIMVKCTSNSDNWQVYHRGLTSAANSVQINNTNPELSAPTVWNSTAPTPTVFSVGTDATVNANGFTYIAYLFAHDAGGFGLTGNDNVISCGRVSMPPGGGAATVNLGYEPQWVLIKDYKHTGGLQWFILDNIRRWPATNTSSLPYSYFQANTNTAEDASNSNGWITSTGFVVPGGFNYADGNTDIIYIAIRRPMKPPTSGTQVFSPNLVGNDSNPITTGFSVDMFIDTRNNATSNKTAFDRLRGNGISLATNLTDAEVNNGLPNQMQSNTSVTPGLFSNSSIVWSFRRAPGFFDIVCYTGTGNGQVINHNLGAVPELAIFKVRTGTGGADWVVRPPGTVTDRFLLLNTTAAQSTAANWYSATSTQITFPTAYAGTAQAPFTYVAYLFASMPGISQVGSYTGNGSSQTINCGFAAGARFVMIKRTDSTGNWFVWDSARGINPAGTNDPYLLLNTTAAEVTTNDSLSAQSVGFGVIQNATTDINVNAATYIFLAIA